MAEAKAADRSPDFDVSESGWLRYRDDRILSVVESLQSEDSYVEDIHFRAEPHGKAIGPTRALRE